MLLVYLFCLLAVGILFPSDQVLASGQIKEMLTLYKSMG